ncbi:SDR family oxidoreductase [Mucilaginibacter sp.]|uniref:SDR family oxidoreductase n=1 Tax=Mucilaginibacter sp. TaxID=1882438 RepID=UPI003D0F0C00
MIVSILGCGWYGKALGQALVKSGLTVKGSTTSADKFEQLSALGIDPYAVNFSAEGETFDAGFFKCDVLVVSIPPKIRHGETIGFIPKMERIVHTIVKQGIKKVIYISSTGVYKDDNRIVDELDYPTPDTDAGRLLLQAEHLFQDTTDFSSTVIRFAGLVGPGRHPGRFFAGKKDIPNGLSPVNLIHLSDCVAISNTLIEKDQFGYVINACSPDHPAKKDFYTAASINAGLPAPEFIDELKEWKQIACKFLTETLNYQFKVPLWKDCKFD